MSQSRKHFTPAQKREYAKLMVAEGYSNKSVQELSGACQSAISRWKRFHQTLNYQKPMEVYHQNMAEQCQAAA